MGQFSLKKWDYVLLLWCTTLLMLTVLHFGNFSFAILWPPLDLQLANLQSYSNNTFKVHFLNTAKGKTQLPIVIFSACVQKIRNSISKLDKRVLPLIFFCSIVGNTNTFNLRVKIESPNGLLLWTGGDDMSPASDFLLLGVENGFLHFRFNLGNGEGGVVYNDTKIDDGKWHRIRASR